MVVSAVGAQANLNSCSGTNTKTTAVTVNSKPVVTPSGPTWTVASASQSAPEVCSSEAQFTLTYTFSTGAAGSGPPYTVAASGPAAAAGVCSVTTPAAANSEGMPLAQRQMLLQLTRPGSQNQLAHVLPLAGSSHLPLCNCQEVLGQRLGCACGCSPVS